MVTAVALGFINRILGITFGLLKSVLIMSVFFAVLNAIDAKKPFLPGETIEESIFYNPISDIAPAIFPIIGEGTFSSELRQVQKEARRRYNMTLLAIFANLKKLI